MSFSPDTVLRWCDEAGFTADQPICRHIDRALAEYRADTSSATNLHRGWICVAVVSSLAAPNVAVERWPQSIRTRLSRDVAHPFDSRVRPHEVEGRRQAVAVWHNLLAFLVFHWRDYGAGHELERMGLALSEAQKELVDSMRIYVMRPRIPRKALEEVVLEFILLAIMDPHPSPRTNPLLWWTAVLAHSELRQSQPRLPIPDAVGVVDDLDFPAKLDALDHYSRALVLDQAFQTWLRGRERSLLEMVVRSPQEIAEDEAREQVGRAHDAISLDWLDDGTERPPRQSDKLVACEAWPACERHVLDFLATWIDPVDPVPISCLAGLLQGRGVRCPARTAPLQPPTRPRRGRSGKGYTVFVQLTDWFLRDPSQADYYPAARATKKTLGQANEAARAAVVTELETCDVPGLIYDERVLEGGAIRVRAVCLARGSDAKAVAWVEKTDGSMVGWWG